MKLLYLTALYPAYVRQFYGRRSLLELESFDAQMAALDADAFAWVGAWRRALAPQGIEVAEILCNVTPLQRTWAWEHDRRLLTDPDLLLKVSIEQVRAANPDVLFFDHYDDRMLREMKRAIPALRLAIGWMGGTTADAIWDEFDLVLSCAPESVEWLRERGVAADRLEHGFNDAVLDRLRSGPRNTGLGFFGQIVTSSAFHGERERFLEKLIDRGLPLEIHSPSFEFDARDNLRTAAKMGAWAATRTLKAMSVPDTAIAKLPIVRRGLAYSSRPTMPVSRKLRPHMREGKFGIDMFNAIADTKVTLNVHADASIRYASNMRLFETAGAGGCLLTDWKENIPELFEPDREIVTYRSMEECVNKIRWLLAHPGEAEAIGKAAQKRTLRQHTYAHRAARLAELIREALRRKSSGAGLAATIPE